MPWYLYAAVTPTLYSFTNFVDKFLLEKKVKDPIAISTLAGLASGILGIIFGLFSGFKFLGLSQTAVLIFAGVLLIFYLIPYFEAMKIEDTSRVVPLFQFIPVFTLILSSIILKENLTLKQIIGLFSVVFAGILLSAQKLEGKIFKPRKALWFMLLASLMYGSVGILFRFVVREANFWNTLTYEYIGTGLGALLLLLIPKVRHNLQGQKEQIKSSFGIITGNNCLAIVAQISESYAVSLAAVPLVNLIGSVQPLLVLVEGLVLSIWFPKIIKEDIRKSIVAQKLVSIIIIFFGLYLVYF